jgi:hypothetical protein
MLEWLSSKEAMTGRNDSMVRVIDGICSSGDPMELGFEWQDVLRMMSAE